MINQQQRKIKKDKSESVAKFIPTSQYFERSFEVLQIQIDGLREGQIDLKSGIDNRFEQVDSRFDKVDAKLDTIIERLDVKIDAGLRENRAMSIRLFSFAMVFSAISMAGLLAKMTGLF
jgi:hypothetical protein